MPQSSGSNQPYASSPNAGKIPGRLSISHELESMSPRDFIEKQHKEADAIRERWAAEDAEEDEDQ